MVAQPAVEEAEDFVGGQIPLSAKAGDRVQDAPAAEFAELADGHARHLGGFGEAQLSPRRDFTLGICERQGADRGGFMFNHASQVAWLFRIHA